MVQGWEAVRIFSCRGISEEVCPLGKTLPRMMNKAVGTGANSNHARRSF